MLYHTYFLYVHVCAWWQVFIISFKSLYSYINGIATNWSLALSINTSCVASSQQDQTRPKETYWEDSHSYQVIEKQQKSPVTFNGIIYFLSSSLTFSSFALSPRNLIPFSFLQYSFSIPFVFSVLRTMLEENKVAHIFQVVPSLYVCRPKFCTHFLSFHTYYMLYPPLAS